MTGAGDLARRLLWDPSASPPRIGRWTLGWTLAGTAAAIVVAACAVIGLVFWLVRLFADRPATGAAFDLAAQPNAGVLLGNPFTLQAFLVIGIGFLLPVLVGARVQGHAVTDFIVLHGGFSWRRFWRSGGALVAVTVLLLPLTLGVYGEDAQWSLASLGVPVFVVATVAVIAVQTFAEEALFRGYLYHAWLRVIPSPALVAVFWSAVFSALHWANPDVQRDPVPGMISLMAFALFAQWLTVRTGNLDAAWGLHFGTNVMATFGLNVLPGYVTDAPLLQYTDRVLAAGGSYALDPIAYAGLAVALGLQALAVAHPRSPFFVAPRGDDA